MWRSTLPLQPPSKRCSSPGSKRILITRSHGASSTQGTSTNNSNLINFDKRFVTPSSSGILRFEDLGNRTGRCYLTCHGTNHNPFSY